MGSFVLVTAGSEDYSLTCMIFLERGVAFECLNVIYFCCAVSQTELDSPPLRRGESKNVKDFSKQKNTKSFDMHAKQSQFPQARTTMARNKTLIVIKCSAFDS